MTHPDEDLKRGVGSNNPALLEKSRKQTSDDWLDLGGDGRGGRVYAVADEEAQDDYTKPDGPLSMANNTVPGRGSAGQSNRGDTGYGSGGVRPTPSGTTPGDRVTDTDGADGSTDGDTSRGRVRNDRTGGTLPESGPSGGGERAADSDVDTGAALGANKMRIEDTSGELPREDEMRRNLNDIGSGAD